MPHDFADIRPYTDSEVAAVLRRLCADREFVEAMLRLHRDPPPWLAPVLRAYTRHRLRHRARRIHSIADFQQTIEPQLTKCMQKTAAELTVTTDEPLKAGTAYLFMSNHRDIAMDPALCNLIYHQMGLGTMRIAIGDNLLTKPFAADLMRLNKSFIVRRSLSGGREKLRELRKLSAYVRHSLLEENHSCWIAQREGRAKDGIDKTEIALIKMLMLARDKRHNFAAGFKALRLIPVSISYEWDPCDLAKATELATRAQTGNYEKQPHEDIRNIARGIQGWKGRVHLHFGKQIERPIDNAEQAAAEIDRQIIRNYRLQPSHLAAAQLLEKPLPAITETWSPTEITAARTELQTRMQQLATVPGAPHQLLQAYANPLLAKSMPLDHAP